MRIIFVVQDCTGRSIRLTAQAWKHIRSRHPEMHDIVELEETLGNPFLVKPSLRDEQVAYYYRFNKHKKMYAFIAVRYLNGDGFIITAYYVRNIL